MLHSPGSRGAASVEKFLDAGYAVIFVNRKGSAQPYERALPTNVLDCLTASAADFHVEVTDSPSTHAHLLVAIIFTGSRLLLLCNCQGDSSGSHRGLHLSVCYDPKRPVAGSMRAADAESFR